MEKQVDLELNLKLFFSGLIHEMEVARGPDIENITSNMPRLVLAENDKMLTHKIKMVEVEEVVK